MQRFMVFKIKKYIFKKLYPVLLECMWENKSEFIYLQLNLEASTKKTHMYNTIAKHFIFFQESMFLLISSLKESMLRMRYMLCIVLGAEEI